MVKVSTPGAALSLAGTIVLASCLAVSAQESPALQPAPPVAPTCSSIWCLIAPRTMAEQQAAAQPQPQEATQQQPAQTDQQATQAQPVADQAPDLAAEPDPKAIKHQPKPKPVITIAADVSQIARLKALAATMPNEKIKIVAEKTADPNFAIETALNDRRAGTARAKLFTEQMHVIAGPAIHTFGDLSGKAVSFGADRSASQIVGRKAFAALGILVKETPLDLDNALDGLATGDIAAIVVLAPQPVARLASVNAPGLHFIGWPDGATVPTGAVTASIDGGDYPGLAKKGETIAALGVDAVLTTGPKGVRSPGAKAFLAALSQHSTALAKRGFDLLKADLESRADRRVASAERR